MNYGIDLFSPGKMIKETMKTGIQCVEKVIYGNIQRYMECDIY